MIERCYRKADTHYSSYGGRGIKICDEWLNNHQSFIDWAYKSGYREGLTIDRIDVNGNYCPENCRWITMRENTKWTRKSHRITVNDITDTAQGWAFRLGYSKDYIRKKLTKYGMQYTIDLIKSIMRQRSMD